MSVRNFSKIICAALLLIICLCGTGLAADRKYPIDKWLDSQIAKAAGNDPAMAEAVYIAADKWDAEMNKYYKIVMGKLDADGQAKLKGAQRAWLKFRDAELTAAEAVTNVFEGGGTMQRLDLNDRRMSLIRARAIDLMEYSRQLSN